MDGAEKHLGGVGERLRTLMGREGSISVERYMEAALMHGGGYYRSGDPLGAGGDFITAPEIGQVFGELIGLWCAQMWRSLGAPKPFILAELGPGRGSLLRDGLRAGRVVEGFCESARLCLVERNRSLREIQAGLFPGAAFYERFEDLPEGVLLLIANEFFDALPVRQFEKSGSGWRERCVTCAPGDGGFSFVLGEEVEEADLPSCDGAIAEGSIYETCPAGLRLAEALGARLARDGGAALIIDFGESGSGPVRLGDTLQAVRRHRRWPVLEAPGEADLAAQVDFAGLAGRAAGGGARVFGPVAQGLFLERLGIHARTSRLCREAGAAARRELVSAAERLIAPEQMGRLFQALAVCGGGCGVPPGFGGAG